MVARSLSFWDGLFSGAMLVLGTECNSMMTERRAVKLPQVRSELEFASHICERAKEDPQNQAIPCSNGLFFCV